VLIIPINQSSTIKASAVRLQFSGG